MKIRFSNSMNKEQRQRIRDGIEKSKYMHSVLSIGIWECSDDWY